MKTIKIFISSTFNDMQAERDVVMTRVAPLINKRFAGEGISIQFIDLRWGVNTGDEENDRREALVLRQCIQEIKESHPFFIAFLGERYGWVPPVHNWQQVVDMLDKENMNPGLSSRNPRSVTDLEIVLGAMASEDFLKRSLFCFRDAACLESIPVAERQRFVEADPQQDLRKQHLKEEIRKACERFSLSPNMITYNPVWNGRQLDGFDKLVESLVIRLSAMIRMELVDNMLDYASPDKLETQATDEYFRQRLLPGYEPEEALVQEVDDCIFRQEDISYIYFQTTSFGTDTAFLAWIAHKYEDNEDVVVLKHASGTSSMSRFSAFMLKRWIIELAQMQDNVPPFLLEEDVPLDKLQYLLRNAVKESGKHVVVLVDNIQSMDIPQLWEDPSWLPAGCLLVAHAWKSSPFALPEAKQLELLDVNQSSKLLDSLFAATGKTLSAKVKNALLEKRMRNGLHCASLPGWIQLAVKYLNIYTSTDVEAVKSGKDADEGMNIIHYQLQLVEQMPYYPEALFEMLVERIGQEYGKHFTSDVVMLLTLARNGINEADLAAVLEDEWNALDFSCIKGWLGNLISEEWDTKRIALAYDFAYDANPKHREQVQRLLSRLLYHMVHHLSEEAPLFLDNILHCALMNGQLDLLPHIFSTPGSRLYAVSSKHLEYDLVRFDESYIDFLQAEISKKPYKELFFKVLREIMPGAGGQADDEQSAAWVQTDFRQAAALLWEMSYLKHAGMLNLYHCLLKLMYVKYIPACLQGYDSPEVNAVAFYMVANQAICLLHRDAKAYWDEAQGLIDLLDEFKECIEEGGISVTDIYNYLKGVTILEDNKVSSCWDGSDFYGGIDSTFDDAPVDDHLAASWANLLVMEYEYGDGLDEADEIYEEGNLEDTLIRLYYALALNDQQTLADYYFSLMDKMQALESEDELLYGIRYILIFSETMHRVKNWKVMQTLLSISWKNLRMLLQTYPDSLKAKALAVVVLHNYASLFDYYVTTGLQDEQAMVGADAFVADAEELLAYVHSAEWYGSLCILPLAMIHGTLEFLYKRRGALEPMTRHGMYAIRGCECLLKLLPGQPDALRLAMAAYGNFGQDISLFYPAGNGNLGISSMQCSYNEHSLAYELYETDPDNMENKLSLIIAAKNYGNVLMAGGLSEKAIEIYTDTMNLCGEWKDKHQYDENIARLLLFFGDEISEAFWEQGDHDEAYALNREAMQQLEEQHVKRPGDRRLVVDLLACLMRRINFDLKGSIQSDTGECLNRALVIYTDECKHGKGTDLQLDAMFYMIISCCIRYNALAGDEAGCKDYLALLDQKCNEDYHRRDTAFFHHLVGTLEQLYDWCIQYRYYSLAGSCINLLRHYKEMLIHDGYATPEAVYYDDTMQKCREVENLK